MLMLGIDPGSQVTGFGVVRRAGSRLELVEMGVLRPGRGKPLPERLARLSDGMAELLARLEPDCVGMESVFHGPNTRSLVTLGQARGALLAQVGRAHKPVVELSPSEIKKAVTGRGSATKEQVGHMVGVLLGPSFRAPATGEPSGRSSSGAHEGTRVEAVPLDATDALAVAIAALHRRAASAPLSRGN